MQQLLPVDIVEEILSRLHVKDLVRFKSVCKKWNSIISSARLIQLHLEKSISNSSHHRIFMPYDGYENFKTIDCKDLYGGLDISVEERPKPEDITRGSFSGTSDGLLCYVRRTIDGIHRACIWNPATRLSKIVNLNLKRRSAMLAPDISLSWFGRESSNDEYKIVIGAMSAADIESLEHIHVIKPCDGDYDCNSCMSSSTPPAVIGELVVGDNASFDGFLLQGRVHWAAARRTETRLLGVVFYFDLGRRTAGEIGTPVGFDYNCLIGVVDGCLFTIIRHAQSIVIATFEIWIMKEYGVSESWTKIMVLSPEFDVRISSFSLVILVGVTDTGDFIFNCYPRAELLIYNGVHKKFTNLVSNEFFSATMYVETLVSPPKLGRVDVFSSLLLHI